MAKFWPDPWGSNWAHGGPGAFGAQNWVPKNMKSWKDGFPNGRIWAPHRGNGLYGTHGAFGQARFPQTPPGKKVLRGVPHFPKNPWAPLAPRGDPYWPLVELFPIWPPAALEQPVMYSMHNLMGSPPCPCLHSLRGTELPAEDTASDVSAGDDRLLKH